MLVALSALAVCAQEEPTPKKVEYPPGFSSKLDVEYTRVKDWSGRMDLYLPPKEKQPAPVVINIVHGDADPTVPYQQSVELHQKFQSAGVKTVFITVPGGAHGKFTKEKNSEINRSIAEFLRGLGLETK